MKKNIIYCPMDDLTCLCYERRTGQCVMEAVDGGNPIDECDAFYDYEEEEEEEE